MLAVEVESLFEPAVPLLDNLLADTLAPLGAY